MKKLLLGLLLSATVGSLGVSSSTVFAETQIAVGTTTSEAETQLRICLDKNKQTKSTVDLMLLLDNSTSLNLSTISPPTDPNETRFEAVEGMLTAIGRAIKGSSARVNFGLVTFSAQAQVRIPLGEVTIAEGTAVQVAERVRREAPSSSQANGTNFIKALDAALEVFAEKSPSTHCRVLVWFTDGMFAHGGGAEDTKRELDKLPGLTCGEGGFAQRVRELGINPFVILLKPSDSASADIKSRSYELMQQVTGDANLPDGFDVTNPTPQCGSLLPAVGEVYDADNADDLAPYFVDIGRAAAGGQSVDDCPIPARGSSGYQSTGLPAARFLGWISLVVFDGDSLPDVKSLRVSDGTSSGAIADYFAIEQNPSDYLLTPRSNSPLEKGWKFTSATALAGACLRAKLVEPVSVTASKQGGARATVEPADEYSRFLSSSDLGEIRYFNNGSSIDLEGLFSTEIRPEDITAFLDVDPSKRIAPDGLKVFVTGFSTEPQVGDCVQNGLQIPSGNVAKSGEFERGRDQHEFLSSMCTVDLRFSKKTVNVDAAQLLAYVGEKATIAGSEGCLPLTTRLTIDGVAQSSLAATLSGNREYSVGLQLLVGNTSFNCATQARLSLTYQGLDGDTQSRDVPVRIELERKTPPCLWCAVAISIAAVILAALLSLLLLQVLNRVMTSLPDDTKLYGYELPIEVGISKTGQVVALHDGADVTQLSPEVKDLRPPKGSKDELSVHTMKLGRRVPGLFQPFREPRAEVVNETDVVYRQKTGSGGLAVPFRQALILRPSKDKAKDPERLAAVLTLLVPRSGSNGGVTGVSRLLEGEGFQEAMREFIDLRKASSAESEKPVAGESKISAGVQTQADPSSMKTGAGLGGGSGPRPPAPPTAPPPPPRH
jgi:hypothetical protein